MQYNIIRGVALTCVLIAVGAVFLAGFIVATPAVALMTATGVFSITVQLIGFVWLLNPNK